MNSKDLESKRPTLFLLGVISALSFTLMAFEWRTQDEINSFPSDIGGEYFTVEIDLLPVTIDQLKKLPQRSTETGQPKNRTNQFRVVPDIMPTMDTGLNVTKLSMVTPSRSAPNNLARGLKSKTTITKSVRNLQAHELPYMRLCGHIKNDIERFQCTQIELKKHVVSNFRMPSTDQMAELPKRVEVTFTIDRYGMITDIRPDKAYQSALSSEIDRVLESIPDMVPATVSGERIAVRFELPIVLERY
jgi:hypothetical protein